MSPGQSTSALYVHVDYTTSWTIIGWLKYLVKNSCKTVLSTHNIDGENVFVVKEKVVQDAMLEKCTFIICKTACV